MGEADEITGDNSGNSPAPVVGPACYDKRAEKCSCDAYTCNEAKCLSMGRVWSAQCPGEACVCRDSEADGAAGDIGEVAPTPDVTSYQGEQSSQPQTQSSSNGGVNIALIIGLSVMCTLFFILMAVALNKRKKRDTRTDDRKFVDSTSSSPPNENMLTGVVVKDEDII